MKVTINKSKRKLFFSRASEVDMMLLLSAEFVVFFSLIMILNII